MLVRTLTPFSLSWLLLAHTATLGGCSKSEARLAQPTATILPSAAPAPDAGGAQSQPYVAGKPAISASAAGVGGTAATTQPRAGAGAAGTSAGAPASTQALPDASVAADASSSATGPDATTPTTADDDAGTSPDAGASPNAQSTLEFVSASDPSTGPVTLELNGTPCAGARCALEASAPANYTIKLTLMSAGQERLPVLVGWTGCDKPTPPKTTLQLVWNGSDFTALYTTEFTGQSAPATCRAKIVQGAWFTFAGDLALHVSTTDGFCTQHATSNESLNELCLVPPGSTLEAESDLPLWRCIVIPLGSAAMDTVHMSSKVTLTAAAQQIVSCTAARE